MTAASPSEHADVEARLRSLRRRLDQYGVNRSVEELSWDELVDLYEVALEDAATRLGIATPPRPQSIGRRFTRRQREDLEEQLAARGVRVR